MSLKGSDILRQEFGIRAEMQEKWKKKNAEELEQAARVGQMLWPERDRYEQFLYKEIWDAREQARKAEPLRKMLVRQRNLAIALCVALLVAVLFLALRPIPEAEDESPPPAVDKQSGAIVTEQNYVASVNSDKYYRLTCDYAENILEENRVYYETAADAEDAGKHPCSACRP